MKNSSTKTVKESIKSILGRIKNLNAKHVEKLLTGLEDEKKFMLKRYKRNQEFILNHWEVIEELKKENIETQFYGGMYVDFNFLPHEKTMKVISAFGGKWEKTLNGTNINYTRKEEVNGYIIRVYAGSPPPNCRIVEDGEEIVPAYTRKKMKLVCVSTIPAADESEATATPNVASTEATL